MMATEQEMTTGEREQALTAGIVALIKIRIEAGADAYDILEEIPSGIHAEIIEELARRNMI